MTTSRRSEVLTGRRPAMHAGTGAGTPAREFRDGEERGEREVREGGSGAGPAPPPRYGPVPAGRDPRPGVPLGQRRRRPGGGGGRGEDLGDGTPVRGPLRWMPVVLLVIVVAAIFLAGPLWWIIGVQFGPLATPGRAGGADRAPAERAPAFGVRVRVQKRTAVRVALPGADPPHGAAGADQRAAQAGDIAGRRVVRGAVRHDGICPPGARGRQAPGVTESARSRR